MNDIFFRELTYRERDFAFFQQDFATAHSADISMREIERVFHDSIINRDLWPPRSSDMTPLRYLSMGWIEKCCVQEKPTHSGRTET